MFLGHTWMVSVSIAFRLLTHVLRHLFPSLSGHSGLGKSTLVNTLFKSQVSRRSAGWARDEKIPKTVEIRSVSHGESRTVIFVLHITK